MENLEQKLQAARDETIVFLNKNSIDADFCEYLMDRKITVEIFENYDGNEKTVYQTGDGMLISKEDLVAHICTKYNWCVNKQTNTDTNTDTKQVDPNSWGKIINDPDLKQAVADGNMDLFRELRKKQGATRLK